MAETVERKSEKVQSPIPSEPASVQVYPDWPSMQAYYGHRVAVPSYYNSSVSPGHNPHAYMWSPAQAMIPPYGTPYAAVYSHGGVYCHPAVPLATLPAGGENGAKPAAAGERSSERKVKPFDGLAAAIGKASDCSESATDVMKKLSQSLETETSTDRSEENAQVEDRKRSLEGSPIHGKLGACFAPAPLSTAAFSSETRMQNEKELKRERRKQSNRESARRSRLRKRAETEELGRKVDSLAAENVALRSEINQLEEKSEKLRLENSALVERLKEGQPNKKNRAMSTENLLSRVENADRGISEEVVLYERSVNSGPELRQLLGPSPRADAVAAR